MSFTTTSMQPQQVGIPDFSTVDPAALAPMDLYDSIFWGKSSPPLFFFRLTLEKTGSRAHVFVCLGTMDGGVSTFCFSRFD